MGNTFTQIHVQFIFAVKYRALLINKVWNERLHQYLTGLVRNNDHKMLQVNSQPDHLHMFIGMRPTQSISALMQNVKSESTKMINDNNLSASPFAWQEGYGAFSYSKSDIPNVISYIQNQEAHHKKESFLDEYKAFLREFEIDFDERYIFTEPI